MKANIGRSFLGSDDCLIHELVSMVYCAVADKYTKQKAALLS